MKCGGGFHLLGQSRTGDPDIVAALDEDFDFDDPDNQLEDDFVVLANQPDGEYRENCGEG